MAISKNLQHDIIKRAIDHATAKLEHEKECGPYTQAMIDGETFIMHECVRHGLSFTDCESLIIAFRLKIHYGDENGYS